MLKRLTAACLLSFAGLGAAAQLPDSADMSAGGEFRRRIDRHTSTKAYRMLFVGTPLIVGGVVMQAYDSDFRRLRNGTAVRSATTTTTGSSTLPPGRWWP
jgi:hypothetical protein